MEEVKAISEWHRRMTHEGLNQKGQRYNMDHLVEGAKVYFYRPPNVLARCRQEDEESQAHRSLRRACGDRQEDWKSLFSTLLYQSPRSQARLNFCNEMQACERYEHEIDYRLWDIGNSKSLWEIYI